MPQSDSGLIDLIAMDRDARAAHRVIADTPSAAPMSRDVASSMSDDDIDKFAASMSSPWQRISRAKIAMGAGAIAVVLVGIALLTGAGGGDDAKAKTAAASAAATSTSMPALPPPSIPPPPPPVETAKPAAVTAAPPTTHSTAIAAKSKPEKARRSTPARKVRSSGPKLTKVASSGIAP